MNVGPSSGETGAGVDEDPRDSGLGVVAFVNAILRRRSLVFITVAVVELLALAFALTRPLSYTSVVAFIPEGQRANTGVSSLAAQFGVSVTSNDGLSSPQFYPELIRSPQFLGAVLDGRATDSASAGNSSLIDRLEIPQGSPRVRRELGIEELAKTVVPNVAIRTGIVSVAVTASDPALARTIADRVLREVTRFNQHTRQGKAAAERQFIERRIAEVRDSLRIAEDRLLRFLQGNRDMSRSATLPLERSRLEREVSAQQLLLSTLGPSYEQARIEEVRDTPVLTILRQPEEPLRPNPRGRIRVLALGLLGGLALGVALAFGLELWQALRESQRPDVSELSTIVAGIRDDMRHGRLVTAFLGRNGRGQVEGRVNSPRNGKASSARS